MTDGKNVLVLGAVLVGLVAVTSQPLLGVVVLPVLAGLFANSLERWFGWEPALTRPRWSPKHPRQPSSKENASTPARYRPRHSGQRVEATDATMLITATTCLVVLGLAMAWAAHSSPTAELFGSTLLLRRLIVYTVLGVALMLALSRVDATHIGRLSGVLLVASFVLLAAASFDLIGQPVDGRNHVDLGWIVLDPGEVAEIALVLYSAWALSTTTLDRRLSFDPKIFLLLSGFPFLLLLFDASLGSVAVTMLILLTLLIVAGARITNLLLGLLPALAVFALLLLATPFMGHRLVTFVDPWSDMYGAGFQTAQSLLAVGSGGIVGNGFGESIQRAAYLPGAETEFVLAVLGEEFGLIAILAVLTLILMISYAGLRTALMAADRYRTLLATGLTALIFVQGIVNVFMVLGMAPPSKVKLPLVSYGPTSALICFAALGILLGLTRTQNTAPDRSPQDRRTSRLSRRRVGLVFGIFLILLGTAGMRALWIGVFRSGELAAEAKAQQTLTEVEPGQRGAIRDRHGFALAESQLAFDVVASPYSIVNPASAARQLAPLIGVRPGRVREDLKAESGFVYLTHQLPRPAAEQVRALDEPGITLLPTLRREHPRGPIALQTIGVVGSEAEGLTGMEALYDATLHGEDGIRQTVTDGVGTPISVREDSPDEPGDDLGLTLDAGLQEKVDEVLAAAAEDMRAKSASAIVVDAHSSEVLASASWPSFNPDDLGNTNTDWLLDRAIGFEFTPGSIFDTFPVAAAIDDGVAAPAEVFPTPSRLVIADRVIKGSLATEEAMTAAEIVSSSNDVGTAQVALRLGPSRLVKWIEDFGFGRRTGIDLLGERHGSIPEATQRSIASIGSLAVGRSPLVTPMQIAAAYLAIANGGVLRTPQIVRQVGEQSVDPNPGRRILSPSTAATIQGALAAGDPTSAAVPLVEPDGTYSEHRFIVATVRLVPITDPRLVEVLILDQPGDVTRDASEATASVLDEINRFAFPYLGIESS